jgi:hypothetical protein
MAALSEQAGESGGLMLQQGWKAGFARFQTVVDERSINLSGIGFFDVVMRIQGPLAKEYFANQDFLRLLRASNPELTGWTVWLVSSEFADPTARRYYIDKNWEQFIYRKPPADGELRGGGDISIL